MRIVALLLIVAVFPWALAVYGLTILAYGLWFVVSSIFLTGLLIFSYWHMHKSSEREARRRAAQAKSDSH